MNDKGLFSDSDTDATIFGFDEGHWALRGVSGEHFGKTFEIDHALVIGRSDDCDLVLASPKVSRRHAQISRVGLSLNIEDLESSNGTFINNEQVGSSKLKNGDQIQFGLTERFMVVLEIDGRAVEPEGPSSESEDEPLDELEEHNSALIWVVGLVVVLAAVGAWVFM